jgi:hypothetical protein
MLNRNLRELRHLKAEGDERTCRRCMNVRPRHALISADPGVRFCLRRERTSAACRWLAVRARGQVNGESGRAGRDPARASGSFGSGLVLLNDAGGDAPAFADRDALAPRPRPDIAAALPA